MHNKSNRTLYKLAAAANQQVKEKDYWLSKLSGEYVKSRFPYDYHKRNAVESYHRLETAAFALSAELSSALFKLSRGSDIRLHITLVTGLNALLYQYMAMDIDVLTIADIDTDIVVGIPILKSETEVDFINTLLVLRTPVNHSITFKELVMKTRQIIVEAIENRDYPLEILARDLNMPFTSEGDFPLLDVALLMENIHDRTYLNHVNLNMIFSFTRCESFIHGRLEYNPLLYRETTIEQIINHFKFLLRELVFNADIPLCKIEMISEEEKKRLLVDFNDTAAGYPQDKSIHELFAQQAEKTPDSAAVVGVERRAESVESVGAQGTVPVPMDHVSITYSELNKKSNRLAGFLRERGVGPDTIAAIMVERSVEMIIGILGILKAGGAYLPIDPGYPQERIDYMLKESGAMILLSEVSKVSEVSGGTEVIDMPLLIVENKDAEPTHLTHLTHPTQLCYIIYTSGSTGRPKGVMVEHRSLTAYIYSFLQEFDPGPGDTVLQQASSSFDAFVEEVYPVLLRGGRLAIPGKDTVTDIARLSEFILKNRVNIMDCSPLLLDRLNQPDYLIDLNGIHTFISGGDVLKGEYIDNLLKIGTVYNTYGPTETTVCSAYFKCCEETQGNIPIGKPIANYNVYILDRFNRLLPVGVPGELCISGVGVARGYLNRPELTAERFISFFYKSYRSYRTYISEKIYKTGDLGRWLPDGNIEFLGRIDQQVKLRGFRLELGEIENRLLEHKNVKEAVVVLGEDRGGDNFLCAYVVTGSDVGKEELKRYLMHTLPGYMIPRYFVFIDKISVTLNGKIDRKSLPAPVLEASEKYAAPRNTIEEKLVAIWSTVLANRGYESIGIDDNFFELGGHSLRAAGLISKIHKELDVNVPLSEIFTSPTIRGLALYIKRAASDKYESVRPLEKKEYYRLSSAQKRLYFLQHMAPESTGYNMPLVLTLGKNIEVNKLESILKQLIARHDALRTSFIMLEDEPVQRIHSAEDIEFEIEYHSLERRAESVEQREQDEELYALRPTPYAGLLNNFVRPFDLSQAPLLRSGLIRLPGDNHIWMVDIHHIVSDGTSMVILQEDFEALYSGEVLSEHNIQYTDFSEWQNRLFASGVIKSQEEYWLNLYRDAGEIPRLDLPLDNKRPQVFTFAGDHYNFILEREDTEKFKSLAARNSGTLYMNILAVVNTLFYKYTAQSDIIIGSGVAGRLHEDLQGIIGMFVNTLAMRNYPQGEKTYEFFLREVIADSVRALENQDMQFEELVEKLDQERDTSRNPLFDISMVVQNFRRLSRTLDVLPLSTPDEDLPVIDYRHSTSKFDMTLFVYEDDEGEAVYISIEYYTAIFKKETIARFARHFKKIVREVVSNPGIRLAEIDILTEQEREDILCRYNDTEIDYPGNRTICELFAEQVERTPDAVAVIGQGVGTQGTVPVPMAHVSLTYKELNDKSNRLANFLYYEKHIRTGDRVGILMDKCVERIAAVLGVLKAGGGYVPIDPSLPEERIRTMMDDAHLEVLISQKRYIRTLNRLQWECESFHTFLCMDSWDIYSEDEEEKSELMDESLWKCVADTAVDDITAGGWISSYTGKSFSKAEMDEYGDNILKKVTPLLHPKMRVLEIGCASGISMYRIAPRVGFYYGTDLSEAIILENKKRVEQEGHENIHLSCLPAHDIDKIEEKNYDLIIINSVIQCFPGHNYLRKILYKAIGLMKEQGYIFIGDVMDQELKADLIRDLEAFKLANANNGKDYTTKTDFSSEFFVSRGFFDNLLLEIPRIRSIEYSRKIGTIENELTRFRYDVLVTIDKTQTQRGTVKKYQQDLRALENQGTEKVKTRIGPHHMAYVIYTSGTAGQPKGVIIQHGSLVNLCVWHNRYYQVTEKDRATQYAGFGFDASVWEIFPYLVKGAAIHIISDDIKLDTGRINDFYESRGITIGFLPTQLCEQFMEESNHSLRVLLTGGDKLTRFKPQSYRLYNNYGPTENTVVTTAGPVEAYNDNIPIGIPIGNVQVYILNKDMLLLQPVGAAGELCIAGAGLARGYLNDPELTAEKFVSISYRSYRSYRTYSSQKIYKTGDLARWLADGNIEFLGRIDYQVKVRGYRIELGEIESRLIAHDDIKEAVVVDRGSEKGDSYLCAYFVSADPVTGGLDTTQLAEYLAEKLPDYMIPTRFVQLGKIPLTLSGKVNRKALPVPEVRAAETFEPPLNEIERKLAAIWAEVLDIDENAVGKDSNFFQLGGHSLKAAGLISKIHKESDVNVPLSEIFTSPTIRGLALYIKRAASDKYESVHPLEKKEYYRLSSAQKRLYFLQHMAPESTGYNMPLVLTLGKNIEVNKLESILKQLIARHESFSTSFVKVNDEPVQKIHDHVEFEIEYYDRKLPAANCRLPNDFVRPFELSQAPLLRSGLIRLPGDNHIWMVDMHHIISDGTSMVILQEDFESLYSGEVLSELNIQYKDFSGWQNRLIESGVIKSQEDYWLNLYRDSGEITRLELPLDYKRPKVFTFAGDNYNFVLEREDAAKFKALAAGNNGTLYMNILAVLNTLFYKYTGQSDIIIGTGIAGRPHADLQGVIGMFVNTLAMRNYPQDEKPYEFFLQEVIARGVSAFENQDMQFEELVDRLQLERDTSRNPLFDMMMVVQNFRRLNRSLDVLSLSTPEKNLPVSDYTNTTSKFDMTFFVQEEREDVYISIEYYTSIFKKETIVRFARHFKKIIREVVSNPGIRLTEIDILTEQEREDILYRYNDTEIDYPGNRTICELFAGQVEQTPDAVAVSGRGVGSQGTVPVPMDHVSLTYKELNDKSNRLANFLYYEKHIRTGDRVGILMDKCVERIAAVLGVLKAGGAYVPVDPSLPGERIRTMMDDAHIEVLLSQRRHIRTLNRLQWECDSFRTFLCMDTWDIYGEDEEEKNELMDEALWKYVAETAVDDITAGGWVSSYTGKPFSKAEMDEYGDNILKKVIPLLHQKMRVLEIGCASGISMYRIASRVGFYYGTDLSEAIILENKKRVEQEGHQHIHLSCVPAHDIDKIEEKNFDLIIINSVIQCFPGHNYLRKILHKAVGLMKEQGYIFIGDVMDQELKADFIRDLEAFKRANADRGKAYTTKTDFSSELFVSRGFFDDLALEIPGIRSIEYSGKIGAIENELTRFRYDVLVTVDKTQTQRGTSKKYQQDLRALENYGSEKPDIRIGPHHTAYVIYTSGTTGQPKGVIIQHGSLVNLCFWHNRYYQVTEKDRVTQYAGFGFDASVWEIFPYLVKGAAIHIISDDIQLDTGKLNEYYESRGITISFLPTQLCEQFMEESNHSLRVLLTGGDKLTRFKPQSYRLYNNYGPTENTVVTTAGPVEAYNDNIPIGNPIANVQVYILNKDVLLLQPVGAAGELCIAGAGLARGYLNDPELTAERFFSFSYKSYRTYRTYISRRIYKTGDLARWLADGSIEFLGRIDQQVKIRGYRIELGEIENQLEKIDGVTAAVVVDGEDRSGQRYLWGYIVSASEMDLQEIKYELSLSLPGYMIPAHIIRLDRIPLTPGGKVDRKALPGPGLKRNETYAAPGNEMERKLVEVWEEVLGPGVSIGIDDNFFDLGGHSLKANVLVSRIHKGLNIKVPLAEVFRYPTIRRLAQRIIGITGDDHYLTIESAEQKSWYELSYNQHRLWIIHQLEPQSPAYNLPGIIALNHAVDVEAILGTAAHLVDRHESFRTCFKEVNKKPAQLIRDRVEMPFRVTDISSLDEEEKKRKREQVIREVTAGPFDLTEAPLFRSVLMKVNDEEYYFIFNMHHIISDGWSVEILKREFFYLYEMRRKKKGVEHNHKQFNLEPLKLQYKDFAQWQNRQLKDPRIKEKSHRFWKEKIALGLPELKLRSDFAGEIKSLKSAGYRFVVGGRTIDHLREIVREKNSTVFIVMFAVFNLLLARLTEQKEIVTGILGAGRHHDELYGAVGFFVNTIIVKNLVDMEEGFRDYLGRVNNDLLEMIQHQDYPLELVFEDLQMKYPEIFVLFNMFNLDEKAAGLELHNFRAYHSPDVQDSKFNMTIYITEYKNGVEVNCSYRTNLFKKERIEYMMQQYLRLLENTAGGPDKKVKDYLFKKKRKRVKLG